MSQAQQEPRTRRRLKDYGPIQAARATGITSWNQGIRFGLIPEPDVNGARWSARVVDELAARADELSQEIGRQVAEERERNRTPEAWGANRIAETLAEKHGLAVGRDDVEELASRGLLQQAGQYKGWPLYEVERAEEVDAGILARIVRERQAWLEASLPAPEAAKRLGWRLREFERVTGKQRGLKPGRFDRWSVQVVDELAEDEELCEQVLADRTLGPEQAAAHLDIRRLDFDHLVNAGLIEPAEIASMRVGYRSEVEVPMYRTNDLDDLLETPGIPWGELRDVKPGDRSPLADVVGGLPPTRAQTIKAFARRLSRQYTIEVHPSYRAGRQLWRLEWELRADGTPTVEQVRAAVEADPVGDYADDLALDPTVGELILQARNMLEPGRAVVIDFETTGLDGAPIEVGVVDAATGEVLLEELIDPEGVEIEQRATDVHGLTVQDVQGAKTWPQVWPLLVEAVGDRTLAAYNAAFDRARLRQACERYGIDPGCLGQRSSWWCAMEVRTDYLGLWWHLPLDGGHRAVEDAQATREVIQEMTAFPHSTP